MIKITKYELNFAYTKIPLSVFCSVHNLTLKVEIRTEMTCVWLHCNGNSIEVANDQLLQSTNYFGNDFSIALLNLVKDIKGKTLVINAFSEDRKEIHVPATLYYDNFNLS